jgi:hypothetical protein
VHERQPQPDREGPGKNGRPAPTAAPHDPQECRLSSCLMLIGPCSRSFCVSRPRGMA